MISRTFWSRVERDSSRGTRCAPLADSLLFPAISNSLEPRLEAFDGKQQVSTHTQAGVRSRCHFRSEHYRFMNGSLEGNLSAKTALHPFQSLLGAVPALAGAKAGRSARREFRQEPRPIAPSPHWIPPESRHRHIGLGGQVQS